MAGSTDNYLPEVEINHIFQKNSKLRDLSILAAQYTLKVYETEDLFEDFIV